MYGLKTVPSKSCLHNVPDLRFEVHLAWLYGIPSGPQICDPSRFPALRGDCFGGNRFLCQVEGFEYALVRIPDQLLYVV